VDSSPKYSIIVPSKGGMPYLRYAVESVLASEFKDLELLVSLDGPDEESRELLSKISDSRLRVIAPPKQLSMSEHWDFAQNQARGQWQMFLGQDDMLMTGYSEAFELLTDCAQESGLGIVVARRAYVCWPPVNDRNLKALQYWKTDSVSIRGSAKFAAMALLTGISYHAGPQMYTTTIVSKTIVDSIRNKNRGKLILGHPQDAFLAASLLKECPEFVLSGQPFSWVGTSKLSAGLAIARLAKGDDSGVASEYVKSVSGSRDISYSSPADFRHGVNSRYFFDALETVWPELLESAPFLRPWFKIRVDSLILALAPSSNLLNLSKKSLVTNQSNFLLKFVYSLGLLSYMKIQSVGARLASKLLSKFSATPLNFIDIVEIASGDELYKEAQKIDISKFKIADCTNRI
jgi:glycosyltransferase involved in cell wall biosynthesis